MATSSRRSPGTRRTPTSGMPARWGVTSSRRARRKAPRAFVELDATDEASARSGVATMEAAEGRLDVLIHNAGVLETALAGPAALRSFDTNAVGIVRVTEAALPLLRKSANANVVTVSSSAGSFWAVNNPERP